MVDAPHAHILTSGRTLLRLNESKLRAMDITTPNHWYVSSKDVANLLIAYVMLGTQYICPPQN